MKQLFLKSLSVFFAVMLFGIQTFAFTLKASSPITKSEIQSVSEFDDSEIYGAFAGITDLDQYLAMNNGKTYSEVSQDNSALLTGVSSTTSLPLSAASGELALGIPSFLWGCAFGWVGLLIVYLVTDKDKEQTRKALWGCVVGTVIQVGLYIAVFATASTNTVTY
jgi:hypothetical protein